MVAVTACGNARQLFDWATVSFIDTTRILVFAILRLALKTFQKNIRTCYGFQFEPVFFTVIWSSAKSMYFKNQIGEGASPSIELLDGTPPAKAKKGRKSKSSLVPPAPEGSISSSKPTSETSSITGEGLGMRTGEAFDGDGTVGDDISVLSLDEGQL